MKGHLLSSHMTFSRPAQPAMPSLTHSCVLHMKAAVSPRKTQLCSLSIFPSFGGFLPSRKLLVGVRVTFASELMAGG